MLMYYMCPYLLSRCSIFRQQAVKMSHLWAVQGVGVCQCCVLFVWLLHVSLFAVKMSHLSSASCQDVSSSSSSRGWCLSVLCTFCVATSCLPVCCQDVPSLVSKLPRCLIFGQFKGLVFVSVVYCLCGYFMSPCLLSRCPIFSQQAAKMSHLWAVQGVGVCQCCVLFVWLLHVSLFAVKMSYL